MSSKGVDADVARQRQVLTAVRRRRTAIQERRELIAQMPTRVFRWPGFLVSAPHAVPTTGGEGSTTVPYGEWHARKSGSARTACGRSAVSWHFFWTLRFSNAGTRACPECAAVLASAEREPN